METPILWPPDVKSWFIGKDPDAGKDWRQEEKGTTEAEMVGWHHWHNGHGFGWTLWVGYGQGGLVCCGSWGRKESDTTEWLNWTELGRDGGWARKSFSPRTVMCVCVCVCVKVLNPGGLHGNLVCMWNLKNKAYLALQFNTLKWVKYFCKNKGK